LEDSTDETQPWFEKKRKSIKKVTNKETRGKGNRVGKVPSRKGRE
jgi:hypothetical protein